MAHRASDARRHLRDRESTVRMGGREHIRMARGGLLCRLANGRMAVE